MGGGEGGIPQSKLTGALGLLGPEDPGRKKRRQQGSNREPPMSQLPHCDRVDRGPREKRQGRGKKGALMLGGKVVETLETEDWT